jgi:hypothetical protein
MALPKSGVVRKFPARYIHLNIRSRDEVFVNQACNVCGRIHVNTERRVVHRKSSLIRQLVREIQAHAGKLRIVQ